MKLPARIGITVLANLVLLGALFGTLLMLQSRSGLESLLLSPSQDRIRGIGSAVAQELPGQSAAGRAALFARYEGQYGIEMILYDREGNVVQGQDREAPEEVLREIRRPPPRPFELENESQRGNVHPVFLVRDRASSLYWIGVHIPVEVEGDRRPVRYALLIVTPTLLGSRLFFDWRPWALGLLAALLVTVLCWLPLIRGFMHSIRDMRQAAGQIAEGHFEVEVPVERKDELGDLAASIGKMAEKLSRLVHGQRRFLADVAHELCAPLSRIQLSSGILSQRVHGPDLDYVRSLETDVLHMSSLVTDLLSFSKGAARKPAPSELAIEPIVNQVVASERNGASDITVSVEANLTVFADEEYLRRAIANIVRNAVAYAGETGPILVQAVRAGERVRLSVQDEGPGLPESELEAVFEPFYRPDHSRDRETGGAGLGLAIVKSCVEACGGTVQCRNRTPRGLEVVMELK